jgi:hypothetical protein
MRERRHHFPRCGCAQEPQRGKQQRDEQQPGVLGRESFKMRVGLFIAKQTVSHKKSATVAKHVKLFNIIK